MQNFVCIECPNGCKLSVEQSGGELSVTGARCKRGEAFAVQEFTNPLRTLCTTVKTAFKDVPVLPVRLDNPIPKARIFDVMRQINSVTVTDRLRTGDVVIKNVLDLGADVIATSGILSQNT